MKGVAKYRYDRIEAQTLLLGDTAFCMRVMITVYFPDSILGL